ncbi:hypothetical protein COCMIDRAFT_54425, partial [Bipolaris oryzae ATCC 44560]
AGLRCADEKGTEWRGIAWRVPVSERPPGDSRKQGSTRRLISRQTFRRRQLSECRSERPSISPQPHAIPSVVPSSCSPTKQPRPCKQDRSSPVSQAKSLLPPAHEVKLSFASGSSRFRSCDAAKPAL